MPEKVSLLTVTICPSVTSWARPRLDAQAGDEEPVPRPEHHREAEGEHDARERGAGARRVGARGDPGTRHRARDRDDGADRQVDPARGDHERHPERGEGERRAVVEDVDEAAVEPAVLDAHGEEARRHREVEQQQRDERPDRFAQQLTHRPHPPSRSAP
jgi:hypothetical protein